MLLDCIDRIDNVLSDDEAAVDVHDIFGPAGTRSHVSIAKASADVQLSGVGLSCARGVRPDDGSGVGPMRT
jgi:hypothetical protein